MDKKQGLLMMAFLLITSVAFAQIAAMNSFSGSSLPSGTMVAAGDWKVMNGKLYQMDTKERLAQLSVPAPQSGRVQYEFDLEYVGGGEDDYAGFGIHILVDNPAKTKSWGNGSSGLLWVTWDPKVYGAPGLFAQAYMSSNANSMTLYPPRDIVRAGGNMPFPAEYVKMEYLNATIPVKIIVDIDEGTMSVYDPLDMRYYYKFAADMPKRRGSYFAFRTNSLAVRVDNLKITKLD